MNTADVKPLSGRIYTAIIRIAIKCSVYEFIIYRTIYKYCNTVYFISGVSQVSGFCAGILSL